MRKTHLFLAVMLVSHTCLAQRVNLDRFSFTVNYRELPRQPLDSSFRTYDFLCEMGPLLRMAMGQESPAERLQLGGWRWVPGNAHLLVQLKMEDLIVVKTDVKQREVDRKDKSGKVIGKTTWYAPTLTYNYAARVLIKDYTGRQIDEYQLVSRAQQFVYTGTEVGNKLSAANVLLNMVVLTTQVSRDILYRTVYRLSDELTRQYGYQEKTVSDMVWVLSNRKHPEYSDFRSNWAIVKNALFKVNTNQPVDGLWPEVQPAIRYFEQLRRQYASHNKQDRKLRYATHFILSKLYYYFDQPERAQQEASDLILNDYDARDGRSLESMANYLKNELQINGRTTRYFPMYINSFDGPQNVSLYSGQ